MTMHDKLNAGSEANPDVHDITGAVKWYDPAKGYGFISPDDARLGDVLLHNTCLRQAGYEIAYQGATIKCVASPSARGLQAIRIISIDNNTVIADAQSRTPRPAAQAPAGRSFQIASVKWFNRVRGYGFVTLEGGKTDIFLHMQTLRASGVENVTPGQKVSVITGEGPKGQMVVEIKVRP